jgi:CyaY protein
MDERTFSSLSDAVFARIERGLAPVEDDVDCERAGDVMTLTFRSGVRCVVNTQRAARQMWMAANARAWHFGWDEARRAWMDDKGTGHELCGVLAQIVREQAGLDVSFGS